MYFVYVLKNKEGFLYKGHTNDLVRRLKEHNSIGKTYTKVHGPWKIIYLEKFQTRSEAMRKELYYKTGVGRKHLLEKFVERPPMAEGQEFDSPILHHKGSF